MNKLFPNMFDRPENGQIIGGGFYWIVCYVVIPLFSTVFVALFSGTLTAATWLDILIYGINFSAMTLLFRSYLKDSFWNVRLNIKRFVIIALIGAGLMFFISARVLLWGIEFGWTPSLWAYPLSETSVLISAGSMVLGNPLFGTLCMTLLVPFTVSCMFYSTVFAPICVNRPVLAYIVTAVLLFLPRLYNLLYFGEGYYELMIYLLQLPLHLVACWTYQKADTVWAPIVSISVANLLSSLLLLLFQHVGYITTT